MIKALCDLLCRKLTCTSMGWVYSFRTRLKAWSQSPTSEEPMSPKVSLNRLCGNVLGSKVLVCQTIICITYRTLNHCQQRDYKKIEVITYQIISNSIVSGHCPCKECRSQNAPDLGMFHSPWNARILLEMQEVNTQILESLENLACIDKTPTYIAKHPLRAKDRNITQTWRGLSLPSASISRAECVSSRLRPQIHTLHRNQVEGW